MKSALRGVTSAMGKARMMESDAGVIRLVTKMRNSAKSLCLVVCGCGAHDTTPSEASTGEASPSIGSNAGALGLSMCVIVAVGEVTREAKFGSEGSGATVAPSS